MGWQLIGQRERADWIDRGGAARGNDRGKAAETASTAMETTRISWS